MRGFLPGWCSTLKPSLISVARKLKLYQLAVFEQVLRSGSLRQAANQLNLTQPAVTKVIHELESYFNGSLLIRASRGIAPTDLGELVARRARMMLAELRAMHDEVGAYQGGITGHVTIGTLISASASLLPKTLQRFKQRGANVLVSLRVGEMDQLFPALAGGDMDIVVGRIPDDWRTHDKEAALDMETLYSETLCVVAGVRHPMHAQGRVTLSHLHGFPWVLPPHDALLRSTVDRLFADAGLDLPADVVESLSILTNVSLMQDQRTVGLVPLETAEQFVCSGMLRAFDLDSPLHFGNIGCFYSAHRTLGHAACLFRECLRDVSRARATLASA